MVDKERLIRQAVTLHRSTGVLAAGDNMEDWMDAKGAGVWHCARTGRGAKAVSFRPFTCMMPPQDKP